MPLTEGKTKIIREGAVPGEVIVETKDQLTGGDAAKRETIAGIAVFKTTQTCNVFRLLERSEVAGTRFATPQAPAWRGEGEGGRVEIVSRAREAWELRKTGPGAGYVVLAEPWYPGWRAEINGKPVEVLRADVMLRAVAVEAGEQRIRFDYRPTFLPVARALTAVGALGLVGLLALVLREARTSRTSIR